MKQSPRGWKKNTRLVAVVVLSLLVACLDSSAGAAQDDLKAGAKYEKQEQFFRAASAYSSSLRLKPGDPKARRALERIADRAIEEKLRSAEALEVGLKADEAIAELDAAARLGDRLAELAIESRQAQGIAARREELVSRRVQPLSTIHGQRYADYSHGIRLVWNRVWIDGKLRPLYDVLEDPTLAPVLTHEGVLRAPRKLMHVEGEPWGD